MSTMAENVIAVGAKNRHPMPEKSQYDSWQSRMVLYIQGEGHVVKQYIQMKWAQNLEWFKEKMLLAEFQEAGVILDEEELAFLADTWERVDLGAYVQALTTTTIFQMNDIDAINSDYDEAPTTSAVFMANLTSYVLNVLIEVPNYNNYQDNNVIDQSVQEM
ncbi:hypothetical protein Tco_0932385 [Tanacetum coccineum]